MRDITYPQAIERALQSKEPNNIHAAYAEGLLGEIFFSKGTFLERFRRLAPVSWCAGTYCTRGSGLAVKAGEQELQAIQQLGGMNSSDAADAMLRLATAHLNNG